jgi:hypothetical protein
MDKKSKPRGRAGFASHGEKAPVRPRLAITPPRGLNGVVLATIENREISCWRRSALAPPEKAQPPASPCSKTSCDACDGDDDAYDAQPPLPSSQ